MTNAPDILLDISRLLSRVRHHTPSGVDRVEMAYARGLLGHYGDRLQFAAVHPFGRYGRLPHDRAIRFLDAMEQRWTAEEGKAKPRSIGDVLPTLLGLLPRKPHPIGDGAIYVQSSPHHLTKPALVRRILERERAQFLCFVHDLIPIEYPEYARPNGAALHRRRIDTIVRAADGIVVNSAATGQSLRPWLIREDRHPDVRVALLGTQAIPDAEPERSAKPYFLCIGTIEPRKNHLLLLHLWRHMAETLPPNAVPKLIIVGRRGWENEQVIDMLERCPALQGHVEERNGCSDQRLSALLRGARALLLPSFAEGYGMPVAEALSVGIPVICSDLPAMREAGGTAPDFLDPLDGPAWQAHILDHFVQGPRHVAQMGRISQWHSPTWAEHMAIVCEAIDALQR